MFVASRGRRYSSGAETRLLLMETAECLFATRGYHAVTLADIKDAAGQGNASVVKYYFGSKEGLLKAILDYRLPTINAYRGELIRERTAGGAPLTLRDVLWCLVEPLADSARRGEHYVGLLSSLMNANIIGETFTTADAEGTTSGFGIDHALRNALAEIPEYTRTQRITMVYASALRTLSQYASPGTDLVRAELSGLIDSWEGLLSAPTSDETRRVRDQAVVGR